MDVSDARWHGTAPHSSAPDPGAGDLPGPDRAAEHWWFTARLDGDGDDRTGLAFCFSRHRGPGAGGAPVAAHAVRWSCADPRTGRMNGESWLDSGCVELARAAAECDQAVDPRVRTALVEALSRGRPPLPDRALPRPARVAEDRLDLDYGGVAALRKDGESYLATAEGAGGGFALRLRPAKPALPRPEAADPSAADGATGYCLPRLAVEGTVRLGGEARAVRGTGWYEHSMAGGAGGALAGPDAWRPAARTQVALRLDNGWELSAARADRPGTDAGGCGDAVLCSPEGDRVAVPVRLAGSRPWTSVATLNSYDTAWRLEVAELGLSLRVRTWFPEQEIRSLLFSPGMLEAHVRAEGAMAGRPVRGEGVLRVLPDNRVDDFERHITRVREVTLAEIRRLHPDAPEPAALAALSGLDGAEDFEPLLAEDMHRSLVRPMRHAVDGLGRSWRSYVATAALELFGVSSEPYRALLAATELLHTGCLVIDDIEDRSELRRGRPAAHTVYGEAAAVNSATAAYFVFDQVMRRVLPDDDRLGLRVYQTYLRALRAGHAGQAVDIAGHRAAMDAAVAAGDAEPVLRRVRAAHRLKTAAPVRGVAEVGALIAGADDERVAALGDYFEAVGLAYQISDDVIDLRGVTVGSGAGAARATKLRAEDLRAGKVTMPLAHAVALLPAERMRPLWETVRGGAADEAAVASAAESLHACGAVRACQEEARELVDRAWKPLQDLLPCSHHAIMIRALGRYAARRERE
ncbi:polyprenyl synthetase family protein [Allonocardiopsis opalescens]|uniref:Geranylgeranyl pyrophosphate synthase n=1 Tax=Allonocardiopsis opalescens TaxID=1144618 RepID=A0A2T0QER6_9ACTN|nr:polyprenyl synthetase family protein [Allonocardiopsis opalescens]PRY02343.1 geranylgeranyl pyrophosphate synthase [Allonocardiopsis opalescens]